MKVSCTRFCIESRSSKSIIGRQARPSANATGTRSTRRTKKLPNRISAAVPGESRLPAHSAASRCFGSALGCARPARTIAASHMRSLWKTNQVRPVTGQAT